MPTDSVNDNLLQRTAMNQTDNRALRESPGIRVATVDRNIRVRERRDSYDREVCV
jgi:hypothetical protein